VDHFYEPFLKV